MTAVATTLGHQEAQARFALLVDRELAPVEEQELLSHLSACSECKRGYEKYAHAVELVRSVERERVPADFTAQVLKRARKRRNRIFGGQGARLLENTGVPAQAAIAIVVAALVAAVVVLMLYP